MDHSIVLKSYGKINLGLDVLRSAKMDTMKCV